MQRTAVSKLVVSVIAVLLGASAIAAPSKKSPSKSQKAPPTVEEPAPEAGAPGITYALKELVKAKSGEFCARYGAAATCIEEVEICLSMVDQDDDPIRVCVVTIPDQKPVQAARQRQAVAQ